MCLIIARNNIWKGIVIQFPLFFLLLQAAAVLKHHCTAVKFLWPFKGLIHLSNKNPSWIHCCFSVQTPIFNGFVCFFWETAWKTLGNTLHCLVHLALQVWKNFFFLLISCIHHSYVINKAWNAFVLKAYVVTWRAGPRLTLAPVLPEMGILSHFNQ